MNRRQWIAEWWRHMMSDSAWWYKPYYRYSVNDSIDRRLFTTLLANIYYHDDVTLHVMCTHAATRSRNCMCTQAQDYAPHRRVHIGEPQHSAKRVRAPTSWVNDSQGYANGGNSARRSFVRNDIVVTSRLTTVARSDVISGIKLYYRVVIINYDYDIRAVIICTTKQNTFASRKQW